MVSGDAQAGIGTQFGKFLLLKKLASGGMGEIFLAKQSGPVGFEKILVIKRILQHHLDNQQYVDMFFSEARTAAMLSHSNVVQVYDMGEVDEHFYIAMEYVHGRSLKEVVHRSNKGGQPVPLAYVADFIAQAAAGLSYSHNLKDAAGESLNLIHRDINPHNILVSYHGEIKVIDFGIAKSTLSINKTETGTIKGKFVYMSPEQSAAEVLDKRSDIFSLGIVLYEMLAGKNPFQRDNIVLSLEAIQRRDPPPITELRPDAEALQPILDRCLAKKREERYFDCSELREDLLRLVDAKALPRPELLVGDWLAQLFADRIEEDRQVLLETGSGTGKAYRPGKPDRSQRGTVSTSAPKALDTSAPTRGLEARDVERAIGDVFSQSGESRVLASSPHSPLYDGSGDGETLPAGSARGDIETAMMDPQGVATGALDDEQTVRTDSSSLALSELERAGDSADSLPGPGPLDVDLDASMITAAPSRRPLLIGLTIALALVAVIAWASVGGEGPGPGAVSSAADPARPTHPPPPANDNTAPPSAVRDAGRALALPAPDATPASPLRDMQGDAAVEGSDQADAATATRRRPAPDAGQATQRQATRNRSHHSDKPRPTPSPSPGSLMVNPGPNFKISYAGQSGRGALLLKLKRTRGKIKLRQISGALEVSLSFAIKDGRCQLRVDARPWAIVSKDGVSVGRTPQSLGRAKRFRLELKSPGLPVPVRLMVFYRGQR